MQPDGDVMFVILTSQIWNMYIWLDWSLLMWEYSFFINIFALFFVNVYLSVWFTIMCVEIKVWIMRVTRFYLKYLDDSSGCGRCRASLPPLGGDSCANSIHTLLFSSSFIDQ